VREEIELLEHHANLLADPLGPDLAAVHLDILDEDVALVRVDK